MPIHFDLPLGDDNYYLKMTWRAIMLIVLNILAEGLVTKAFRNEWITADLHYPLLVFLFIFGVVTLLIAAYLLFQSFYRKEPKHFLKVLSVLIIAINVSYFYLEYSQLNSYR